MFYNENASAPSDMVAENTRDAPLTTTSSALALVNTVPSDKATVPTTLHPEHHWNGRRETLGSWLSEFETVLSTTSPEVHEFAVEYFLSDRSKTVIFFPGQAAQLDGAIDRPEYSWANPAPTDAATYHVPDDVVIAAYHRMHHERCLRDANLDPTQPPDIPHGSPYPINDNKYTCSQAQLHRWQVRLRNARSSRTSPTCRSVTYTPSSSHATAALFSITYAYLRTPHSRPRK